MSESLAWIFLAFWGGAACTLFATTLLALTHPSFRRRHATFEGQPPVSVVVPLKGLEPELENNMRGLFCQDYPVFELEFAVADPNDPAAAILNRLMAEFPDVPARLHVGDVPASSHLKTNNMIKPLKAARHDLVLITDCNVSSPPDRIRQLVRHLTPGIGLVSAVAVGVRPTSFAGQLECQFLNGYHSRFLMASDVLGRGFALGKTMLFRMTDLEAGGGIDRLSAGAADDAEMTEIIHHQGLIVIFAADDVETPVGERRFADCWSRHLRWMVYRKIYVPASYLLEPGIAWLLATIFGAYAWAVLFGVPWPVFAVANAGLWMAPELVLILLKRWPLSWLFPVTWLMRELMLPLMWCRTAMSGKVWWKGQWVTVRTANSR